MSNDPRLWPFGSGQSQLNLCSTPVVLDHELALLSNPVALKAEATRVEWCQKLTHFELSHSPDQILAYEPSST
jgi:hypothetical protein